MGRPFAGLPGECDWVALREIVPAATMRLQLAGGRLDPGSDVDPGAIYAVTLLPMAWPALRHADGRVLLGLQVAGGSGDASRDLAAALELAVAAPVGTPVAPPALPGNGPRLQDLLDLTADVEVVVTDGFDFWLDADVDLESSGTDVRTSLEQANANVVPTVRLCGVDAAYWCRMGEREHLRWVLPHEEEALLDALARLRAGGRDGLLPGGRLVGTFRAHGLVVPVWDLPAGTGAEALTEPAAAFQTALHDVLADPRPLTGDERRSRAGLTARQVTLR